jgi:hypothetical protein
MEVSGWLAWRTKAGSAATPGISVVAAAGTLLDDTLDGDKLGKSIVGRESASATTLADQAVCQKSSVNSARKTIIRCCLADQGGVPCAMVTKRGLWTVRSRKRRQSFSSRKRKWRTVVSQREPDGTAATSAFFAASKVAVSLGSPEKDFGFPRNRSVSCCSHC